MMRFSRFALEHHYHEAETWRTQQPEVRARLRLSVVSEPTSTDHRTPPSSSDHILQHFHLSRYVKMCQSRTTLINKRTSSYKSQMKHVTQIVNIIYIFSIFGAVFKGEDLRYSTWVRRSASSASSSSRSCCYLS